MCSFAIVAKQSFFSFSLCLIKNRFKDQFSFTTRKLFPDKANIVVQRLQQFLVYSPLFKLNRWLDQQSRYLGNFIFIREIYILAWNILFSSCSIQCAYGKLYNTSLINSRRRNTVMSEWANYPNHWISNMLIARDKIIPQHWHKIARIVIHIDIVQIING